MQDWCVAAEGQAGSRQVILIDACNDSTGNVNEVGILRYLPPADDGVCRSLLVHQAGVTGLSHWILPGLHSNSARHLQGEVQTAE